MDSGMNREELINKLQDFKKACSSEGYIYDELTFDEAYPGIVPTSYIVNVVARKSWLYTSLSKALDKLIDVLWATTEEKTRESVFTLSVYSLEEMVNSERTRDREQVATNPDLTAKQIEKLFNDPKISVRHKIINNIQSGELALQQIHNLLDVKNDVITAFLIKRYQNDKQFQNLVFQDDNLKLEFLKLAI